MKTTLLKGLSIAGLCWLALSAGPLANAGTPCPSCPPSSGPGYARTCNTDCCLKPAIKWLVCPRYYILPPDYGWNAPTKVPVNRNGVAYYRYWPEHWYGTGSSKPGEYRTYPTVGNPTDTTQLGYTYQHVPTWQSQPSRLPPAPVPSQWQVREAHQGYNGSYHSYFTPIHARQASGTNAAGPNVVAPMSPTRAPCLVPPNPEPTVAPAPAPADEAPAANAPPPAEEPPTAPQKLNMDPAVPAPAPPAEEKSARRSTQNSFAKLRRS